MENKSNPKIFVVIFLVVSLIFYWLFLGRTINGVPVEQYWKIEKNYDSLKVHYNNYKSSGRQPGFIKPEEIDILREIFIFLHAKDAQAVQTKFGIPASICMAQAIIESDAGTSFLADSVFNFFGVKDILHSKRNYLDSSFACCIQHADDYNWDHFRRYANAEESFEDYGRMLLAKDVYYRCFKCGLDYKCWARRLERAGYATNKQYAEMLIAMVEMYKLDRLDTGKGYKLNPKQIERLKGEKENKRKK
jgi:uncharacterized FlgJ-related protein